MSKEEGSLADTQLSCSHCISIRHSQTSTVDFIHQQFPKIGLYQFLVVASFSSNTHSDTWIL